MARLVSLIVLVVIILLISALFFRVMATFAIPLFLAAVLVVIFNPLHGWILNRLKGNDRIAAGLTTLAILLIVLVPTALVISLAAFEGVAAARAIDGTELNARLEGWRRNLGLQIPYRDDLNKMDLAMSHLVEEELPEPALLGDKQQLAIRSLNDRLDKFATRLGQRDAAMHEVTREHVAELRRALRRLQAAQPGSIEYDDALLDVQDEYHEFRLALLGGRMRMYLTDMSNLSDEELRQLSRQSITMFQEWLLPVAGATTALIVKLIIGVAILIVSLYYFLADGPSMIRTIMRLVPLDDRFERELLAEFVRISRAVVVATLLSAVVQGLLAAIGFTAAGLGSIFLLMFLTIVFAMIPFVGSAAVWIPACLWLLLYEERWLAASLLALYGTFVISLADNIVKPYVLHGQSRLHPLLALLSVLGGVQVLGPIGILIGPMVVAFLQTLLNILHNELSAMERTGGTRRAATSGPPLETS